MVSSKNATPFLSKFGKDYILKVVEACDHALVRKDRFVNTGQDKFCAFCFCSQIECVKRPFKF